jgi:DNA-binding Lrp family transcriptional regulator
VIERLAALLEEGAISRIGAVVAPHRAGWSTLAAMAVPPAHLAEVAALVTSFPEVNHNYEREHELNLWFVVAAPSRTAVAAVLSEIVYRTSLEVLDLPLIEAYRLDLGFALP